MMTVNLQEDDKGNLKHLLSLEYISKKHLLKILDLTRLFVDQKNLKSEVSKILANKTIINLFFENSTRTRTSFEIAAKKLGANVINFNVDVSSTKKGETLADTIQNLEAMSADLLIVRHPASGAAEFITKQLKTNISIINAGDGCHEHPSQGLLDLYTIRHHKPNLNELCVTIVGDIMHSRVARSQIHAFSLLGISEIRLVAPSTLMPPFVEKWGVKVFDNLTAGIENADVIIMLRLQKERMQGTFLPSLEEYKRLYGLTLDKLNHAKKDVIVMHPGPINRDLEITSEVADSNYSIILQQVFFGTAVRMAIMAYLLVPEISV